jgi:hypothetical protein
MNVILGQYKNVESRILPYLRGTLTSKSLRGMLSHIRNIADTIQGETKVDTQDKIVSRARVYIAPKDLNGIALTAHTVIESLAVSVFLNEYLMTLTSLPGLKIAFWNNLEKDGLNYHLWSSIERAMNDHE